MGDLTSWRPGPYRWFPYPKPVGGYRKLMVTDVVDRVVYRILAFSAANSTDGVLSRRIFGHRLDSAGSWSVWPPPRAWRRFLRHQLSSRKENEWAYTCVSDLKGYYLAIDTDLMCTAMRAQGIPNMVVAPVERVLHHWHGTGELRGLPMGAEASGVLSAGYLLPIDGLLVAVARDFALYGDDFTVFDGDVGAGRAVLQLVDHHLKTLSLTRNVPKTEEFLDPVEAYNHIQNKTLAYIDAIEDMDDELAVEMIYKVWDEKVLPMPMPDISELHFVLGRLAKRKDPYAVPGLLSRVDLLQVDPKSAIGYLIETVAEDQDVAEQLAGHLAMPPTVTTEALHLHICRFLASAGRSSVVARHPNVCSMPGPSFGVQRGRWRPRRAYEAHAGFTATPSTGPMPSPTSRCGAAWWARPREWSTTSAPGGWPCPTWLSAILLFAPPSSGPWLRRPAAVESSNYGAGPVVGSTAPD